MLCMIGMCSGKLWGWIGDRRKSWMLSVASTGIYFKACHLVNIVSIWQLRLLPSVEHLTHLAPLSKLCLILNGRADPLKSHSLNLSLVHHQVQDDYLKFVWISRESKIELKNLTKHIFLVIFGPCIFCLEIFRKGSFCPLATWDWKVDSRYIICHSSDNPAGKEICLITFEMKTRTWILMSGLHIV